MFKIQLKTFLTVLENSFLDKNHERINQKENSKNDKIGIIFFRSDFICIQKLHQTQCTIS